MESWRAQGEALTELARTVPATAEGLQELNSAATDYWKTTLQLTGAIIAAKEALGEMFASTRENIIESLLSPEELLAREKQKLTDLQAALDSATDPATVTRLSEQINASINKVWGMLSPEDQKAQQADFLAKLDAISAQADTKLNASLAEIRARAEQERNELTTSLNTIVNGIVAAGNAFNAGANTIQNVADDGITVHVVTSSANDQVTG
jgi:phosphate/sulfate permease